MRQKFEFRVTRNAAADGYHAFFGGVLQVALLVTCVVIAGCGPDESESGQPVTTERNVITTTFYPTTWIAEQIAGPSVLVECIVPKGEDPSDWRPDDAAIQQLQSSKLIVLNGAGFESWVTTTTLPASRVVDSTAELPQPFLQYDNVITHQHGPAGDQSREGVDEHTWLDPTIAKHQATRIAEAAKRKWPQLFSDIDASLKSVTDHFDKLDARFADLAPKMLAVRLFCSEPAYNYLARRYLLKIECLNLSDSDQVPESAIADIESPAILLWPSAPNTAAAERLLESGIHSVTFATGAEKPESGDYLALMNANIDALEKTVAAINGEDNP